MVLRHTCQEGTGLGDAVFLVGNRNDNVLKIYRMFKEMFVGCFYSPRPRCCLTLFLHTVKSIQTHIPPTLLPSLAPNLFFIVGL